MIRRPGAVAALALAALVAGAALSGPAAAHVTVNPREATQGGYAKLAFRVPNERPDAGTVKLEVFFPADHPFRSVSLRPQPGWEATVEKQTLETPLTNDEGEETTEAVSKITWEGGIVNPGEFQEFEVSAGPMPEDADQLVFKAIQTYSSGEVVSWIEEPVEGGEEPEHPAPVLKLVPASDDADEEAPQVAAATTADGDEGTDPIAVIALIAALAALGVGIAALVRKPQRPAGAP